MKALLTFVASLFCVVGVNAASPSFSSFFPNHFLTNNLIIKANLNPTQFDTNASTVTITITNVSGVAGLLWTNDTSIGSSGRLMPIPGLDYAYVYPSNFYNHGWFTLQPEFHLLGSGTNTIGVEESSHLMFSMTNDPTEVIITLEAGFAMGQELLLMSYTNTVFNGRFTLPADSVVSGGGFVKLNNNEDWLGENGAAIRLIWIEPDWWEQGRWTAGSNVTADVIWANVAGVIQPRGGQITNALQFISGSANAATNTLLTLDTVNVWTTDNSKLLDLRSVGTNVAYVTPSGSFESGRNVLWGFPSRDDILVGVHDASLGESSYAVIYTAAIDGNTETNYSDFGVTLNTGASPASTLFVASVATNLVSSFNVSLQPDQGVGRITLVNQGGEIFQVTDHGGTYIGSNSFTIFGPLTSGEALVSIRDVAAGEQDYNGIIIGTKDGDDQGRALLETDSSPGATLHLRSTTLAGTRQLAVEANAADFSLRAEKANGDDLFRLEPDKADGTIPYLFDTSVSQTLGPLLALRNNTTNALTFGPSAQITFGVGTTNVLSRNGERLRYANESASGSVFFEVKGSNANTARYGVNNNGDAVMIVESGKVLFLTPNGAASGSVTIQSAGIIPDTDDQFDIGSGASNGAFQDIFMKGVAYIQGLNDGVGNRSRLEIEHDNSIITFDSTALGTGSVRPFVFQSNGVDIVRMSIGSVSITNGTYSIDFDLSTPINPRISANYGANALFIQGTNGVAFERIVGTPIWYIGSAGGNDLLAATDGGGNIGLVNNNRPANIRATTTTQSPKHIWDSAANVFDTIGSGTPEGSVTAGVGSTYRRTDGGSGTTFYVKESGTGNTGWIPK